MEIDDPYRELGLTQEASDTEVKAAWRRLTARWHPDRNASPKALLRIQRINRALEEIRKARRAEPDAGDAATPPAATPGAQGEAMEHTISLSLEEAASGCIRTVQGQIAQCCSACGGSGEAPEPVACESCAGRGKVPPPLWFSWLTPKSCDACAGLGARVVACSCCQGSGQGAPLVYRSKLRIPPGVRDSHHLHASLKVKGREGHQSLDVRISLQDHAFMALQEDGTIQMEVPVDGFAWIAGRWIDVPTPYGMRQMRLQRGALTYRMREAGFPARPSGPRADCLVTVVPQFPAQWSEEQEALLDALVATNTADAGTPAGAAAQAWERKVAQWRQQQDDAAQN